MTPDWIIPDWQAPPNVGALQTTRHGGFSREPYASLNLGEHVGDDPLHVQANRRLLQERMPGMPLWLQQVHGIDVLDAESAVCGAEADAVVARSPGRVCAVMTADCLPVLLCDCAGTVVAAAHCGWRSLAGGILERTVEKMGVCPDQVMAWLGPAIGPEAFEVGDEVWSAFVRFDPVAAKAFVFADNGKWLADLFLLARQRLFSVGVHRISGSGLCTFLNRQRFFSYRRDGVTGRMGSFIWLRSS